MPWLFFVYLTTQCQTAILLTNSMYQSSSTEADNHLASQTILCISWIPKVHCSFQNSLPLDPTLTQINAIHKLTFYLLQTHLNIILPFLPRSHKWYQYLFWLEVFFAFLISHMHAMNPVCFNLHDLIILIITSAQVI